MEYSLLLSSLETLLGKSYKKARNNHAFTCPFCNHRKPKLEIQMVTNSNGENPWECWVCNTRGRTINSLLYQLRVPKSEATSILQYVKNSKKDYSQEEELLSLPEDFQPLFLSSSSSIIANNIRNYLYKRGLSDIDFLRYNIGYSLKGDYGGRIIVPSYDQNNNLNYFIARTFENNFYKYKNPPASKDIIFFENLINWNQPIILVEGVFDAIAARRNAIPILGKTMSKALMKKLAYSNVKDIYVALDKDALKEALSLYMKLIQLGKNVYLVELDDKDPSEIGFENFTKKLTEVTTLTLSNFLQYKLTV